MTVKGVNASTHTGLKQSSTGVADTFVTGIVVRYESEEAPDIGFEADLISLTEGNSQTDLK